MLFHLNKQQAFVMSSLKQLMCFPSLIITARVYFLLFYNDKFFFVSEKIRKVKSDCSHAVVNETPSRYPWELYSYLYFLMVFYNYCDYTVTN